MTILECIKPVAGTESCQSHHVGITDPIGRRDDHFVARFAGREDGIVTGMLGAVAHDDLARAIFEAVVGRELIRDGLAQFRQTGARGVLREATLERSDRGRLDVLRRVEVGFAGAEAADVEAFAFHRLRFAID